MVGQVASRADVYFSCFWRLEAQVRVLADTVLVLFLSFYCLSFLFEYVARRRKRLETEEKRKN